MNGFEFVTLAILATLFGLSIGYIGFIGRTKNEEGKTNIVQFVTSIVFAIAAALLSIFLYASSCECKTQTSMF